jgi:two-component system, OmpR family, phosphate regulon sensor histidine kinase PhoR
MLDTRPLPLPAMAIAALGSAGIVLAGGSPWIATVVAVLWIASLFLGRTEPAPEQISVDPRRLSSDAIVEALEGIGQPLLVLDGTRITVANAAARAALGAHVVGQDARIGLRHPEAVRLVSLHHNESVTIPGFTGGRSLWQLTRRDIADERWMIEMSDRTAEADVSRAHTDFVANASHELRTPLAAIIGYVETLSEPDAQIDASTRQRFFGIIQREAQRMLALVEDLMTLSHVEAEKHDRPSDPIDLGALAARVVGEITTMRGKERVELRRAGSDQTVLADPGQVEQVLRNLIDNALKYGAPDTPVEVIVRYTGAEVMLEVSDSGPGIAAEHLPHLTRRFYRTDPGRSRASGGTGLGLAIVKHIVERHRARLDIVSAPGEGTTVTVAFPAVQFEAEQLLS